MRCIHPGDLKEGGQSPEPTNPKAWGMRTHRPGQDAEMSRGWGVGETTKEKAKWTPEWLRREVWICGRREEK